MAKSTIALFLCGIAAAIGLAVWQYHLAPQGTLLYTPSQEFKPNYTPSSSVWSFVATLCLSAVSASVVIVSLAAGTFLDRRLLGVAKQAVFLFVWFGFPCTLTAVTEQFWP